MPDAAGLLDPTLLRGQGVGGLEPRAQLLGFLLQGALVRASAHYGLEVFCFCDLQGPRLQRSIGGFASAPTIPTAATSTSWIWIEPAYAPSLLKSFNASWVED